MDTQTGRIYTPKEFEKFLRGRPEKRKYAMQINPTAEQMKRRPPRVGRNDLCPCGSGNKFKKCCWNRRFN